MANENKEIGEIVKKCKILLLDIEGTTTSISFVKDKLFPYAEENVKQFLDSKWETDDVKEVVTALRKLALEDQEKSVEGAVSIPGEDATKDEQIEGLVKNVKWQMSADRKAGPLKTLQGLIWKQGYDNGDIKGHVYDDVSPALKQWRSNEGQKVYIYSSGSVDAQKLLFGQSLSGDLLPLIDGHFDTGVGAKQEAASYANIFEKIGCKADEILFLTDIVKEAEAARESGLHVALVSREGNAPIPSSASDAFAVIHSLEQLVSNKRKPDTQEEQPAKVPKTDVEADVKSVVEAEPVAEPKEEPSKSETKTEEAEKPEQMEVEETPAVVEKEEAKEEKMEVPPVETTVVEVTDATEIENVPVLEIEPVVSEEIEEKTEIKETEKIEAKPIETIDSKPKESVVDESKKGKVCKPVADKTSSTVITVIEDISEKQDVADVEAMTTDDIEPIVEEPTTVEDIEDLQNVGEVLEKECDEILSKVQDVTNWDNIPVKPLLNVIAEETMETENLDSNDIVERILDTEQELKIKNSENKELSTVDEIPESKTNGKEDKVESQKVEKASTVEKEVPVVEEKVKVVEPITVTDGNIKSSLKESKVESESKVKEVKIAKPVETESKEKPEPESKVEQKETKTKEKKPLVESVPEKQASEKQALAKQALEKQASEKQVSENQVLEKQASEKQASEKQASEEEASEKQAPEKQAPEKQAPEKQAPEKQAPEKQAPEKQAPEKQSPAKEALEKQAPEKQVTDKQAPEKPAVEEKEVVELVTEDTKPLDQPQVNGKTTNGDTEMANLNGDASKEEELSSRLSVEENGKTVVNGSNGNSNGAEKGQGDSKVEAEVTDMKVKTVAVDEPRTDPIEQPTEA